jgi:hypothetical protein
MQMGARRRRDHLARLFVAAVVLLCCMVRARAQDMEPRAYSAVPIDTNFLIANYARTWGSVLLDPSLPITNVKASINTGILAYDRTFDLFGKAASAAILLPYDEGQVSGDVFTEGRLVSRSGLGDLRLRITDNFIGNPALSPEDFAQRSPTTTAGASLSIIAPTGDYNPAHLVNIGSNRWAFRPDIGVSQPLGNWFADAAAGVWLFTDNHDFLEGHVSGETPVLVAQAHAGYNFRPNLWVALDGVYLSGGNSTLDGVPGHDAETAWRSGLTMSFPIGNGISTKLSWATWLFAHNGGSYNTIGITLQYRWFDR